MSINQHIRDKANADLHELVTIAQRDMATNRLLAADMIQTCRRLIAAWNDAGGENLDEPVIAIYGISSQTEHVLGGSQMKYGRDVDHVRFEPGSDAEKKEFEELGQCFKENFESAITTLSKHLNGR